MDVYDYAMKMEEDGRALYLHLAEKTTIEGVKNIFRMLADDEQKHYEIFESMKAQPRLKGMTDSVALAQAKNVFEKLRAQRQTMAELGDSLETYRQAMQIETDSVRLYEETAAKEKSPDVQRLLRQIAAEEQKHYNILENLYLFANAPNEYLAWREFSNVGEFHQFGRDVDG